MNDSPKLLKLQQHLIYAHNRTAFDVSGSSLESLESLHRYEHETYGYTHSVNDLSADIDENRPMKTE